MTSSDRRVVLTEASLAAMLRTLAKTIKTEAVAEARTTKTLSGSVEQLDEDLDVVWVRMDQETTGSDPTLSDNWGSPGVIAATRLGETFTGDQVRLSFNGYAGADAQRTSTETRIVLPFGAEDGPHIVLDGETGQILFYDEAGLLVGFLDGSRWAIGDLTTPGRRAQLDPLGGLRIRSDNDVLVAILNDLGYSLRSPSTGLVTAEIQGGSFRLVDPTGVDDIEMVTSSAGTLPNPVYKSAIEANPGSSLVVPTAPVFTSTPADDIEIGHVAAWLAGTSQSATMTPAAGWTEIHDESHSSGTTGTIHHSTASRQPATGTSGTFTSTLSNWQHAVGTHVVIKGGGASSPTVRATAGSSFATSLTKATVTVNKPTGTVADDTLLIVVDLGVKGGFVPTGWTTPEGFVFLGANWSTSGSGTSQSTLATGVWAKQAGASEPASYSTTINLPTGAKLVTMTAIAVQNAFLVPGGVQIRVAGHPMRRRLAYTQLAAASATLCDFQNISQAYDNLELIIDAVSDQNGAAANLRVRMRYNADTGNNYFYQLFEVENAVTAVNTAAVGFPSDRILLGGLSAVNGAASSAQLNILGYANAGSRKIMLGRGFWAADGGLNLRNANFTGQWSGTVINRVTIDANGTPNRFAAGSRAYLYGY